MPAKTVILTAPELSFWERILLVDLLKGLARTGGHLLRNLIPTLKTDAYALFGKLPLMKDRSLQTIYYPEEKRDYSERFRGRHILTTREDGSLKCVACYMCQTNCPADCISIEAGEHPMLAYEKYPVKFEIDLLRCVMCGYCVDACPKDAIWMTRDYELAFLRRGDAVYGIPELTEKASDTAPGGPGYGYRPYYGKSPKRKAGEFEPSGMLLMPSFDLRNKAINRVPPPAPPVVKPAAA